MRSIIISSLIIFLVCLFSCQGPATTDRRPPAGRDQPAEKPGFDQVLAILGRQRDSFARRYPVLTGSVPDGIRDHWVSGIGQILFQQWEYTPWDFNGTSARPGQGPIACGYFVTTVLQNMGCRLNRIRLSTCASAVMMRELAPHQRLMNLSRLDQMDFQRRLSAMGPAVYVIGLDYHTGFIVNDGNESWFIHSNYLQRIGVVREPVATSAALWASRTRWLVSLTGDRDFLTAWLQKR